MSEPWIPKTHHKLGMKTMLQQQCAGLFLDPGLGKTAITYASYMVLRKKGMVHNMLVIAPLRVAQETWPEEQQLWTDFHNINVGVLHGPDKEKILNDSEIDVHVINPEGLPWLFDLVRDASKKWDMLVIDESTRFKNPSSQRFRWLHPQLPQFRRRYILTGTPTPNGLQDLYAQMKILDLGASFGNYPSHFLTEYFTRGENMKWYAKPDTEDRIYKRLGPMVLRLDAKDWIDLPPLIGAIGGDGPPLIRLFDLPKKARKLYDMMWDTLMVQVRDDLITAANAGVMTMKVRQIANGCLFDNNGVASEIHEAKLDALESLVEEAGGVPVFCLYQFEPDRHLIQRRFKDAPYIGGGVSTKRFKEIKEEWNKGNLPLLLAQPQSVAHGLNMQHTRSRTAWFGLTWNLEDYGQAIRRTHRTGQKHRVFVDHFLARNTVEDQVMLHVLRQKDKSQRALLDRLRELAR